MIKRLDLSSHCIHTEIKRIYNQLVRGLIRQTVADSESEAWVDVLADALRVIDFPATRAKYSELSGKTGSVVTMEADSTGVIFFHINDICIQPVLKGNI